MRYFYVDFENVSTSGLAGVEKLTDVDNVRIYYSNNPNIKMETVQKLMQCNSKFNFYKLPDSLKQMNLENALDIVLLNDVLRMSKSLGDDYAVVISKDTEFDLVIKEINETNNFNRIFRAESIEKGLEPQALTEERKKAEETTQESPSSVIDENALSQLFEKELSEYKLYKDQIIKTVRTSKSKNEVNNVLMREIGGATTTIVIKALRPIIKDLPGQ